MDPTTRRTCTNNDQATCQGGPGCCSMCGASEFYDAMESSMLSFWSTTGIAGMEQDGAESWQDGLIYKRIASAAVMDIH